MNTKPRRRLGWILNSSLLFVIALLLVRPGGYLNSAFGSWRQHLRESRVVTEHWDVLASTTSRMDTLERGPVDLVEFGDYECPFCRRAHSEILKLLKAHPGVAVGYRHYPLTEIHPTALDAARAALCAEAQGSFSTMHALLMETDSWRETADWQGLAARSGVENLDEFARCLTSVAVDKRLEEDKRLGDALGVTGTPTFVFRSAIRRGYLDEEQLNDLIGDGKEREE